MFDLQVGKNLLSGLRAQLLSEFQPRCAITKTQLHSKHYQRHLWLCLLRMRDWLQQRLASCLGFPNTEDIADYILGLSSSQERVEYLNQMLDPKSNPEQAKFIKEFIEKQKPEVKAEPEAELGFKVYKKKALPEENLKKADKPKNVPKVN